MNGQAFFVALINYLYNNHIMKPLIFWATLFVLIPISAHAYIDPGTGAVIIQSLIAFLAAVFFYLKNPILLWKKIKKVFSKNKKKNEE